ncbi:hypothetical protein [Azospirillum sp. INR13]|uniref:hypothetical protein n=1 Tax=Azospirillum sp. INR13 TaxID=2596919 RepID=UPI0019D51D78|nr:hypothetical protein [Azospirillum sp. INR13]
MAAFKSEYPAGFIGICIEPLFALGPAAQPGHLRRGCGLIEEYQPIRFLAHPGLAVAAPSSAAFRDVGAPGLARQQSFF